jgi:biotin-(acetyl-CoA carboxylase) ligase
MRLEAVWAGLTGRRGAYPASQVMDWRLHWVEETGSTNGDLFAALQAGTPLGTAGTVLVAGHQRQGRGRRGRDWNCPAGEGLLVSLRLDCGSGELVALGPLALLAALDALEQARPADSPWRPAWKWPNDLLLCQEERVAKLGGLLIQTRVQGTRVEAVLGLGLNLRQLEFPTGLRWPAVSLAAAGWPAAHEPEAMLAAWLAGLEKQLPMLQDAPRLHGLLAPWDWLSRAGLRWRDAAGGGGPVEGLRQGHDGRLGLLIAGQWRWLADGEVQWMPEEGATPGLLTLEV